MRAASLCRLDVLAVAAFAPPWASGDTTTDKAGPKDVREYAKYAAAIATRYGHDGTFWRRHPRLPKQPLIGIELWNEPNLAGFWKNLNASAYTALARAAYPAIKAVDPQLTVVVGALAAWGSPGTINAGGINPVTFLEQMYAAGLHGFFDALSVHPYSYRAGATAVELLDDESGGWLQLDATSPSIRSVMRAHGDAGKRVWATEVGAPTNVVGEDEQAALAGHAVRRWASKPWAGNFYWYTTVDGGTDPDNAEDHFGLFRTDWSAKPAADVLRRAYTSAAAR